MTRRRELRDRLTTLGEIRDIMGAMKNLAFAEHRKLGRHLQAQDRAVRGMEAAAGDLLVHYPQPEPDPAALAPVLLVVGSERGFCGDFNEVVAREAAARTGAGAPAQMILAVGYRLGLRLEGVPGVEAVLEGAAVAEELEGALGRVVAALREMEARHGPLRVEALHHDPEAERVRAVPLFPPFQPPAAPPGPRRCPPHIHLAPDVLFRSLVDQYLPAALNVVFLNSLLAENEQRMRHLEGAVRRLDERREEMTRRANILRQEEITEEIEMILLNVESAA